MYMYHVLIYTTICVWRHLWSVTLQCLQAHICRQPKLFQFSFTVCVNLDTGNMMLKLSHIYTTHTQRSFSTNLWLTNLIIIYTQAVTLRSSVNIRFPVPLYSMLNLRIHHQVQINPYQRRNGKGKVLQCLFRMINFYLTLISSFACVCVV